MSKRAVIYARGSTDIQRDNFSISSQISECLKHAEERGYVLYGNQYVDSQTGRDVFADTPGAIPAFADDYTSRELSRPSLGAALFYLDTYGFDVLIVHALDRLARDPYIRQTLEREFNNRGARVEYVLGSYEETPEGEVRKDLDCTQPNDWADLASLELPTHPISPLFLSLSICITHRILANCKGGCHRFTCYVFFQYQ